MIATMLLCLWAAMQILSVVGVLDYLRHLPRERLIEGPPGVVVILSVRDDWDGGAALIDRLARQSGASFRLILATSGHCPAARTLASSDPDRVQLVCAGVATDEGQKIHKLRAAIAALAEADRYLVFIDADILPADRLIGRLLFPLVRNKAEISTGYRLLLPATPLFGLVGAVELQLATLPRPANSTMPWGGAMAMRRETADALCLTEALAGRLSDDLSIGLAAGAKGLRMRPVRDLLVATPLAGSIGATLQFGVRQYRHVRTNSVRMWSIATLVVALQSVGWTWALLVGGWHAVLIGYIAAWIRVGGRGAILRSVLERPQLAATYRSLLWDMCVPFIVIWTHLAVQLAAATSDRIRWGGYDYRVKDGRVIDMEVVGQKPAGN